MIHKLIMSPAGWAFDRFMVRWTGSSPLSAVFAWQARIKNESRNLALVTKGRKSGRKGALWPSKPCLTGRAYPPSRHNHELAAG